MSFHHDERIKRLELTKQLREKGFSVDQLAKYFGVRKETVEQYLTEMDTVEGAGSESGPVRPEQPTLFSYTKKTVSINEHFIDIALSEGFQCLVCKHYRKFEAGRRWRDEQMICMECYRGLTPAQLGELK